MLTLYNFLALDETSQYNEIWNGEFLTDRKEDGCSYQLYSISDFFVEVQYNPEENKIEGWKAFKKGERLDAYADSIFLDV